MQKVWDCYDYIEEFSKVTNLDILSMKFVETHDSVVNMVVVYFNDSGGGEYSSEVFQVNREFFLKFKDNCKLFPQKLEKLELKCETQINNITRKDAVSDQNLKPSPQTRLTPVGDGGAVLAALMSQVAQADECPFDVEVQ